MHLGTLLAGRLELGAPLEVAAALEVAQRDLVALARRAPVAPGRVGQRAHAAARREADLGAVGLDAAPVQRAEVGLQAGVEDVAGERAAALHALGEAEEGGAVGGGERGSGLSGKQRHDLTLIDVLLEHHALVLVAVELALEAGADPQPAVEPEQRVDRLVGELPHRLHAGAGAPAQHLAARAVEARGPAARSQRDAVAEPDVGARLRRRSSPRRRSRRLPSCRRSCPRSWCDRRR